MAEVLVYTTDPCPYCTQVKRLFTARGVEYEEVDLARNAEGRAKLVERTGMMTFPQVLVGGELIGGFQETLQAERSGRLAELLAA